jgi:hypothetical protein
VIDQQNIEMLQKMVDDVGKDINTWIDVTCIPGSDRPGEENPPTLEFTEMLWNPDGSRAIITRSVKYEARQLE